MKKMLWLAFSTKTGRQLQAGASGVATVRLFQKAKLLDYKSLPQSSLHVGFQQHPPSTALPPGRSCSAGSACLPLRLVGEESPIALLTSLQSLKMNHQQISTTTRTNISDPYSHQVNEATRGTLGWQNFTTLLPFAVSRGESTEEESAR